MTDDIEVELKAIRTLQETLQPLPPEVRDRVLEYVFRVMGIAAPPAPSASPQALPSLATGEARNFAQLAAVPPARAVTDVSSLKEEKQPSTVSQMVALVAYYLAHSAPANERQDFVTVDEVRKYFVQAHFPLPGSLSQSLVHAKNAGYLDAIEKGKYRLNTVGYNLVAHKMPKESGAATNIRRKRGSKKAKKQSRKKAKR